MEKDLKTQNLPSLTALYLGMLILVALVHWSIEHMFAVSLELGQQFIVVTAIASFGQVLSLFMPYSVKHVLVYFRISNVLSGHRSRRIFIRAPRLRSIDLERMWPMLFLREMKESKQNAFWYNEIYWSVRNDLEVVQAHRSFLLFRDAASGLFVLLVGLLVWKAFGEVVPVPSLNTWSVVILVGVILLLKQTQLLADTVSDMLDSIRHGRYRKRLNRSYERHSKQPVGKWNRGRPKQATDAAGGDGRASKIVGFSRGFSVYS